VRCMSLEAPSVASSPYACILWTTPKIHSNPPKPTIYYTNPSRTTPQTLARQKTANFERVSVCPFSPSRLDAHTKPRVRSPRPPPKPATKDHPNHPRHTHPPYQPIQHNPPPIITPTHHTNPNYQTNSHQHHYRHHTIIPRQPTITTPLLRTQPNSVHQYTNQPAHLAKPTAQYQPTQPTHPCYTTNI